MDTADGPTFVPTGGFSGSTTGSYQSEIDDHNDDEGQSHEVGEVIDQDDDDKDDGGEDDEQDFE